MRRRDASPDLARAKALMDVHRWQDAIPFLHRAVAADPDDVIARCRLSLCLYNLRRHLDAIREAEAALAIRPEYEWPHRLRGLSLARLRRYEEAAESFRQAARCLPDSAYPWQAFGYLADRVEFREEVLSATREAVRVEPDEPLAWFALGRAYRGLSDFAESAEAYRTYLRLKPQGSMGHNNLGWALFNLGRLDEAEDCFRRSIALGPGHEEARIPLGNLASLVRMKGDVATSNELFERLRDDNLRWARMHVDDQPGDPVAHDTYVFALSKAGRHAEAWDELRAGLRRFPDSKNHWETMALWSGGQGRYRLSEYATRRILDLDPRYARAMEHLTTAQVLLGKVEDARRTALQLNELVPGSPEAERALGDVRLGDRDWSGALRHFETAARLEPLNCCYMVRVGVAKARMDDREGAEAAWRRRDLRGTLDCHCAMLSVFAELLGKELP